jgi:ubiquinone/menaquinone biosynthesis C-methylase UbiE
MMGKREVQYGNWVSVRIIGICFAVAFVFGVIAALIWPLWGAMVWGIVLAFITAVFLACGFYFIRARYLFSDNGAGIQKKILDTFLEHIYWNGRGNVLDIGCGSGLLAVRIAQKYKDAKVAGIDYWGKGWEYSKSQCETNAAVEGVGDRTAFAQASASELPYPDKSFDLVVSNLVFHEVKDSRDKRALIYEALRVVKKGGAFVLQDLFLLKPYFGEMDELAARLRESGIQEVHFEDTSKAPFIPKALKLPFMLGTVGILYGVK